MSKYSGFLIADPGGGDVDARELEVGIDSAKASEIKFRLVGSDFGLRVWGDYRLHSPQPLADEEWSPVGYEYRVYVVRGRARLIVLAPRRTIAEYLWTRVFQALLPRSFRRVNVRIPELVTFCGLPSAEFLVTSLFGDFSGSATYLKRVALYGDEVTQSALYDQYGKHFNFYRCGLGRRLFGGYPRLKPNEEGEIVQLASTGNVSMELRNRRDARELINVINFVMLHRWVEDWVPD
jgi:hypothetical protein